LHYIDQASLQASFVCRHFGPSRRPAEFRKNSYLCMLNSAGKRLSSTKLACPWYRQKKKRRRRKKNQLLCWCTL